MFLGTGAIILQVFSVVALFLLFIGPKKNSYLAFIDKHYLTLGFLISLGASLFSLVYSEIINFLPCYLCWYQRIFLFPLVFIFGSAIWYKDRKIVKYVLPLLSAGFLISVYQNFGYYFAETGSLPCDASGISCYQQLVSEFGGYISIPMLALTSFFGILTIVLVAHFYKKED
ncbi:MAG: putative disulfide formation protein [Candidatus Nomurabacteria bacterium GW2011_GWC2_39_41]|uniref:Putative disulfide formation protein n=2 Tax=Candidatus Nomuraibacteriota TaxID=1752729 RepID=A0A837HT83_9BACT|nr:MAG: putative disulfide formation protein [Candidatus Nomurabacteria bacterium GW2011_GWD2_39_12]KKR20234.1 MAG: putative disulfide formation protein [Candidatus Nomurabacteria bacterium GW2011_GWC2_39_41]KKR36690.1 MAG: putative disulfide formation protein [Candidatus Nomurabacteria bacterium GW2011_GWE2_40_10]KKR38131.1 MAG: putative disulfide formation protein [Candidatus Nomurabacteria bacterium GW2011_GWB1_40_11]KKR39735.1 MAG: putative disulfide formation protein [Parcubacteria group b